MDGSLEEHLIAFHFEGEQLSQEEFSEGIIQNWIVNAVASEEMELEPINFIFCDDTYLHKMNVEYLNHDTLTDVITFDYSHDNFVSGDVFISIERVRENALKWAPSFRHELCRVIIHGVLHLMGYTDKKEVAKQQMTSKEDFYLSLLDF